MKIRANSRSWVVVDGASVITRANADSQGLIMVSYPGSDGSREFRRFRSLEEVPEIFKSLALEGDRVWREHRTKPA